MQYCGQCGAEVSESAKFCEQCGIRLPEIPKTTSNSTLPEVKIDVVKEPVPEQPTEPTGEQAQDKTTAEPEGEVGVEELDLTALDKKVTEQPPTEKPATTTPEQKPEQQPESKKPENIINLQDVLESEEKVEADDSIKREVLADDEVLTKVCPMCGEDLQLNKKLLENAPVLVKCLKCGNDTKVW